MTDKARADTVKVGLPPVAREDARLFVLGSLPGDASISASQYYAHPRNQFWRLLGATIREDLHSLPYSERLDRLAERRIGLWDVVGSAVRRGSLDQAIRSPGHNEVGRLLRDFKRLEALAFNGSTAALIGRRLLDNANGLTLIDLPSSSPANTRPFAEKAAAWAQLAQFVRP